jgi:hypothetical protein
LIRQINGLRNRDIRALLFRKASPSKAECQRHGRGGLAKAVSAPRTSSDRQGAAYAPISSHRGGTLIVTELITARNVNTQQLTKLAA